MKCNKCNYEFLEKLHNCPRCGANIEQNFVDRCPNCHTQIDINMTKCMTCGFNLKTLNNSEILLTVEGQEKIGKNIGKIFLGFTILPLIPFFLILIGMFLVGGVAKKILTISDIIIGIKYLLIMLSSVCFFIVIKNNRVKSNKIISNIVLTILGILFVSPVVYFSFFSNIGLVNIKEDIKIKNISMPTIYQYTQYDDSLLDFKLKFNELTDQGKKIEGSCVFSLYYDEIPNVHINFYKEKLLNLGYQTKFFEDAQLSFVKNNDTDFTIINIDGASISYCVVEGKIEDYKGEWDR